VSKIPQDPRLFELFCGAIETGLEYVRRAETGTTYIGSHNNWPELMWHDNGLPYISNTSDGPKDYGDAIRDQFFSLHGFGSDEPFPEYRKEQNFLALVEYTKSQQRLNEYLQYEKPHDVGTTHLHFILAGLIDRYVHVNKSTTLDRGKLLPDYLQIENCLLKTTLPVIVMVPILFLKFEFERFSIDESISIEQLSDELQLARGYHGPFGNEGDVLIESAATHGLFMATQSSVVKNAATHRFAAISSVHFLLHFARAFPALLCTLIQ
jgi:hypothetical protein